MLIQRMAAAVRRVRVRANDSRQMVVKAAQTQVRDSENAEYNRTTTNSLSMARSNANRTPAHDHAEAFVFAFYYFSLS